MTGSFLDDVTVEQLDADPYPIYARMRAELPVGFVPAVDTWFVTRHADVQRVAEDSDGFTAEHGDTPVERTFGKPAIIAVDGPVHQDLRKAFDPQFRPRRVEQTIDGIVGPLAQAAVDALSAIDTAPVDLMASYFEPISVLSLARVLGLGDLDADTLRRWFKGMNLGATNFERDSAKQHAADAICAEIDDVIVPRMQRLLTAPDATTMSDLLHAARNDGAGPRPIDLVLPSLKVALLGGMQEPGHGGGTVVAGLFTRPEQFDELRNDRAALIPHAVDEGLRWIAPIGTQIRTATRDVDVSGTTIPRGATVSAILASANRDETVYPNADVFDLHRGVHSSAAFGFGKHYCSGHAFSRHQIRIALDVLLARFPDLTPATAAPVEFRGWEFRAPVSLAVRLG